MRKDQTPVVETLWRLVPGRNMDKSFRSGKEYSAQIFWPGTQLAALQLQ